MPSFNHTREDGFYDPCAQCWGEMSEADKIESVLGMSDDPYEDGRILECLQAAGHPLSEPLNELRARYQNR